MSYDPSHRMPPRQERWPAATPPEGWPSYRDGDAYQDAEQADSRYAADRQGAYSAAVGYQQPGASGGSGGRVSDVAPAVIGGIAGVAALLWLMQASAPAPPVRHTRGNRRRRP